MTRTVMKSSLELFADLLDVKPKDLHYCRRVLSEGRAYRKKEEPKRSGGVRIITAPCHRLKVVQRKITHRILTYMLVHTVGHGFLRGRDIKTGAAKHDCARSVFNVDLRNAFPSVRDHRVRANIKGYIRYFLRTQFRDHVSDREIDDIVWMIVFLCTFNGELPQGAPSSPAIMNIVAFNLDVELWALARKYNLRITRYADDITFSSKEDEIPSQAREEIRATISAAGWKINQKKVKYIRRATGGVPEVTGLNLRANGGVTIPKPLRKEYGAFLSELLRKPTLTLSDIAKVRGIVGYVKWVYGENLVREVKRPWERLLVLHPGLVVQATVKLPGGFSQYPPPG